MQKLFFYDLETTGLDCKIHGIHQLSAYIEIDGKILEKISHNIKPYEGCIVDKKAIEVSNVTEAQILAYPTMANAYVSLMDSLAKYADKFDSKDKFHLVGYNNNAFDKRFFRAFFDRMNDKYFGSWFWSDSIDTMCLAANKLKSVRSTMPNFQLQTAARQLGIEVDATKLHNAEYDLHLTREIYYKCS